MRNHYLWFYHYWRPVNRDEDTSDKPHVSHKHQRELFMSSL